MEPRRILAEERGSGTGAALIGAFGAIIAAIIGGLFVLASANGGTSGGGGGGDVGDGDDFEVPEFIEGAFAPASVFLSRDSGPSGTTVNVSGEGFQAGERVVISFHTQQIGSTNANDAGSFSNVAVEIPSAFADFAPQQFDVIARGESSIKTARAPFTLSG